MHKRTSLELLYFLAVDMLCSRPDSELGRISAHSGKTAREAEELLHSALTQFVMPGKKTPSAQDNWTVVRVFARNLANRAHAPMTDREILTLLNTAEVSNSDFQRRIEFLLDKTKSNARIFASLSKFLAAPLEDHL